MSKVKLHFGQLTIRLLLFDIGNSPEHQLKKHTSSSFKYLSRQCDILRNFQKNVLKKQYHIKKVYSLKGKSILRDRKAHAQSF